MEEREGVAPRHELVANGTTHSIVLVGLMTFQYRAVRGSIVRWASLSVVSSVSRAAQAFPRGFSGPQGRARS